MSFTCALCCSSLTFPYVCKSIFLFLSLAECLVQVVWGALFSLGLTFSGLLCLWLRVWVVIWISTGCLDWLLCPHFDSFNRTFAGVSIWVPSRMYKILSSLQLFSLRTCIWTLVSLIMKTQITPTQQLQTFSIQNFPKFLFCLFQQD